MSQAKNTRWVDLDYRPEPGVNLVVATLSQDDVTGGRPTADAFDIDTVDPRQQRTIDQARGYHHETLNLQNRGLYWRLYFGTRGIRLPFEVYGFIMAFHEEGQRKGRVRTE